MNSEFSEILNQSNGNEEYFKKLITEKKDIINKEFKIIKDSQEYIYSPLTYCLENKLSDLSIILIEQGANVNYKTSPNDDYPLLIACRYGFENVVKKLLLCKNIDINCLNKKNETWYTILLNNLNVSIFNLMQEYINPKSKKEKEKENKPKEKDIIKRKKYINNKKKIMINNLSFDFPLEYNKDIINTKISK
jgi:ankyrin repeat protein